MDWDQSGNMLFMTKQNRIEECIFKQLHIMRTRPAEFVLRVPIPQHQPAPTERETLMMGNSPPAFFPGHTYPSE